MEILGHRTVQKQHRDRTSSIPIGYSPLFMIARAVWRTFERPYLVGGVLMLFGYLQGYWKTKRISSPELVRFVRRQQIRRLFRMESQWR